MLCILTILALVPLAAIAKNNAAEKGVPSAAENENGDYDFARSLINTGFDESNEFATSSDGTCITLIIIVRTYDETGMRRGKANAATGSTVSYYYVGGTLMAEFTDDYMLVYVYSESGSPMGFAYITPDAYGNFDGSGAAIQVFAYQKNVQGDVVGLVDCATGAVVDKYVYNAWGKL